MSSNRIGGRNPLDPQASSRHTAASDGSRRTTGNLQPIAEGQDTNAGQGSLDKDSFQRAQHGAAAKAAAPIATESKNVKVKFGNKDLEYLFAAFAALIVKNKGLTRSERARLFVASVLKNKGKSRLKKVIAGLNEQQMEKLFGALGDCLDSSPVFGSLLDTVSDEAAKTHG